MALLVAILIFGVVMLLVFVSEVRAGTLDLRIRNESAPGATNAPENDVIRKEGR